MADFYKQLRTKKKLPLPKWKEVPIFERTRFQKRRYEGVVGLYTMGYDILRQFIKKALWK